MTLENIVLGTAPDYVPYLAALDQQNILHQQVIEGKQPSTVVYVEHHPVYTAGKRSAEADYPYDGTEVIKIDRGGQLTWHGPGQLVGYPIVSLSEPIDVVAFVRLLEETLLKVIKKYVFDVTTVEGRSGIWVPEDKRGPARKIAAIGIRVASNVTMHGFAINCTNDLRPFGKIVPCGITDASVTSIQSETGKNITPGDIFPEVQKAISEAFENNPHIVNLNWPPAQNLPEN